MTLTEIIDQFEARRAEAVTPIARTAALTPKGDATVAGYRFVKALRELPVQERADVLALVSEDLRAAIAELVAIA